MSSRYFFFNDTSTTKIFTLSLHDALPISPPSSGAAARPSGSGSAPPARGRTPGRPVCAPPATSRPHPLRAPRRRPRSEEHTSELQSRQYLVCRLLLEKIKNRIIIRTLHHR